MAKLSILAGATSQSVNVFIQDSSSTVGAGLSGLVFNTSGLIGYYTFAGANASSVQITLATLAAVNSAYSSGGFKEIDATNMKGLYRLDLPNAAIASAKGRCVTIMLSGATNMAPLALEIELTGWDNQDGVRGGMTALPNAAANAAGGLPVSIAGGLDLDEMNADIEAIQTSLGTPLTAAQIATGVWTDTTAGDFTTALSIGKSVMNGVALGTGLTINQLTTNNDKTGYSLTQAFPTNFSALSITAGGHISNVDTLTTYTGNTVQTGDGFARLGAPAGASVSADIAAVKTDLDAGVTVATIAATASNIKKNTALSNFDFVMTDATTHAPKTGLTVTATRKIDGGAFAACTNAVTEVANGWYTINLAAADMNGNVIALRFTAAAADDRNLEIITQP